MTKNTTSVHFKLESILPDFVFICFPIFPVKLECLQNKKNAFTMNWPSSKVKKWIKKIYVSKEKVCEDWLLGSISPMFYQHLWKIPKVQKVTNELTVFFCFEDLSQ